MTDAKVENIKNHLHYSMIRLHRKVFPFPNGWLAAEGQKASDLIRSRIVSEEPCLITRFGSIELEATMAYLYKDKGIPLWERLYRYASWDVRYRGWHPNLRRKLSNNAGFFPTAEPLLDRFAQLYLDLMPQIDILGSWIHSETAIRDRMPNAKMVPLNVLLPYLVDDPWSAALAGRNVLVIHPFIESIRTQYRKRALLFKNTDVLPEFNLLTLEAVQSAGKAPVAFPSWFEALKSMQEVIHTLDFDIALIGAGAYGFPLAAEIKSMGKQALHLGGNVQMLFGVYGKRWMNEQRHRSQMNEHWVRPLPSERPNGAGSIEDGCYW